jgi:Xaa-Pro aminopeptidase
LPATAAQDNRSKPYHNINSAGFLGNICPTKDVKLGPPKYFNDLTLQYFYSSPVFQYTGDSRGMTAGHCPLPESIRRRKMVSMPTRTRKSAARGELPADSVHSVHAKRCANLRKLIRAARADSLLVTNFLNVTYLTGFTGDDSYLLVTADDELLVTDRRYTRQLSEECPKLRLAVREPGEQIVPFTAGVIQAMGIERLGVEAGSMVLGTASGLLKQATEVSLVECNGLVEQLRVIKDRREIELTRVACCHARRAFEVVRAGLTPQMTEFEAATELEYQARRLGARALSFRPIIAVGPRSELPHATPGDVRLGDSEFTLFDWGALSDLYMSDLTRMVVTGRLSAKFREVYGVVLTAQMAAIDAIAPGKTCEQVDQVARQIITKAGYGQAFGHGLGHGLGLEIHESPRLAQNQQVELRPGMIVTVEPGIYLHGWGGIRIEDDVLVTRTGHEVLSDVPKQLEDCILNW